MSADETIRIALPGVDDPAPDLTGARGDLTEHLLTTSLWSDSMLAEAGIPVIDASLVSVGGGLGSFVLADVLRIAGIAAPSIKVLGATDAPWATYEYLTGVSQIPRRERLRSDSSSTPDNIWGFPSYAVREAFAARSLRGFVAPLFQVATEPIFTEYYTPRAGQVFEGLEREAARISYGEMHVKGLVRMVRKRDAGGYFTILTPPKGSTATVRVAYRSRYVHLAVGYPGVRFLPDLQEYRQRHQDYHRVVNAYEPHEHVYDDLRRSAGTVLVRGGGIVASRILQRLIDDRDHHGAETTILHLFRTFVDRSHGPSPFMRRRGRDGWAYQGFNWPKGAWGGQLKSRLEKLEGEERKRLYDVMGGTNTPRRKLWLQQLSRGRREGFYRVVVGEVRDVTPGAGPDAAVITRVRTNDGILEVPADYIIDATGLEADIREHRLLADVLDHTGADRNPLGRLDVERDFEVRGTRSGDGRLFASGSATLGGYYCGVDSFLGLQYAALRIADHLAGESFGRRLGRVRSTVQWWKWLRNRKLPLT
jgi:hypothetical protein